MIPDGNSGQKLILVTLDSYIFISMDSGVFYENKL